MDEPPNNQQNLHLIILGDILPTEEFQHTYTTDARSKPFKEEKRITSLSKEILITIQFYELPSFANAR